MWKTIIQNKIAVFISIGVFLASTSTLLIFLDHNNKGETLHEKLKTDVLSSHETDQPIVVSEEEGEIETEEVSTELYYRKLLHDHRNPILALNLDGTISFASNQLMSKLEYNEKDLYDKSFFLIFHQDDLPVFLNAFSQILKTQSAVTTIGPYRLKAKNGTYQYHIGYATPIVQEGKMVKILIVTKSIEDKMKNNEEDHADKEAGKNEKNIGDEMRSGEEKDSKNAKIDDKESSSESHVLIREKKELTNKNQELHEEKNSSLHENLH